MKLQAKPSAIEAKPTLLDILPFFTPSVTILSALALFKYSNNVASFTLVIYGLFPLAELISPLNLRNYALKSSKEFEKDWRYLIPLYSNLVLDFFFHFFAIYGTLYNEKVNESWGTLVIFVWNCAIPSTMGGLVAHELIHHRESIHKFFGWLLLYKNLFTHYAIQHIQIHHKLLATAEDASSAPKNQSVFSFFLESLPRNYESTWTAEKRRLKKNKMNVYSLNNFCLLILFAHVTQVALVFVFLGKKAVACHLAFALYQQFGTEVNNYVEHYGLVRKKDKEGIYEPINASLSWSTYNSLGNYLLFKLPRHADHHMNVYKPYQILEALEDGAIYPYNYLFLLLTALVPPVWYYFANPLVDSVEERRRLEKGEIESLQAQSKLFSIFAGGLFIVLFLYFV